MRNQVVWRDCFILFHIYEIFDEILWWQLKLPVGNKNMVATRSFVDVQTDISVKFLDTFDEYNYVPLKIGIIHVWINYFIYQKYFKYHKLAWPIM